ncbi:MFS transporter [Nocardiopsis metallicus]|uniref:EmrB/QacA subfamily drug resistance transporter n=1 Tax=Nocardiopsis metallicus TaxID=179819 RepID=A0A840W1N0_9ACTN|nr:MFS transporter [Nocardiopsis metallicus]MBB5490750.1 EmrB/QacA subfamily drug resistance transporter [Nocardiopsis metallicus]
MKTAASPSSAWTLAVLVIAAALMAVDLTIVAVALPQIGADLPGATLVGLQWVVVGYTLAFGTLVLPAASLGDRIGARTMFLWGVVVFTVASLLCGLAWDLTSLVAFRLVKGAAAAVVSANVMPLLSRAYDEDRRPMAIAVWTASLMAAATLAPVLGGFLVETAGWRSMFLVNLPIGTAALLVGVRVLSPDTRRARGAGFDWTGAVLVALVLLLVNLGLTAAQDGGSWWAAVWTGSAAAFALGYALHQRRTALPVLDLALFRIRSFLGVTVLAVLTRVGLIGGTVYFVLNLQDGHGLNPLETGLLILPVGVGTVVGALAAGKAQARFSAGSVMTFGFVFLTAGGAVFAWQAWNAHDPLWYLPTMALWGLANGAVNAPLMAVATAVVPAERVGMATGVVNSSFPLGAAVGTLGLGAAFTASLSTVGGPGAAPALTALGQATGTVYAVIAAVCLLGVFVAAFLVRTPNHASPESTSVPR